MSLVWLQMRKVTFSLDQDLSGYWPWVIVSWVSEEGDVVTVSQGQWKQIPHSKEAALSLLPKETTFCHVHTHSHSFPRNFWTWRSIPPESVGGKVQIPEISSNCFLKRSGCRKEIWWWLQWGKVAVRVPFSLSNGELTLWRNLKTTPKCSWRFIFPDKHQSPVKTSIRGKPGLLNYSVAQLVCYTWALQLQPTLLQGRFQTD